jgi:CrcB protein
VIPVLVMLGAIVGAPTRYLVDRAVQRRHDSRFPWGTLGVNVAGSLLLGFLVGLPASSSVLALAGTGFCGALTTFSTFSFETMRLLRSSATPVALANVVVSLLAGMGAAFIGYAFAGALG